MTDLQITRYRGYDTQMGIHTSKQKDEISLEKEHQKHLSDPSSKNCVFGQSKYRKRSSK